jgi:hypothetical protein
MSQAAWIIASRSGRAPERRQNSSKNSSVLTSPRS